MISEELNNLLIKEQSIDCKQIIDNSLIKTLVEYENIKSFVCNHRYDIAKSKYIT